MLLAVWFVLVTLSVIGLYVPLQYWTPQLRGVMPQDVSLQQASGHWWSGQALFTLPYLQEPARLNWTVDTLLSPITWQLEHPKVIGYGQIKLDVSGYSLWVEELRAQADVLNPVLIKQNIKLSGQPITVSHWYSHYVWSDHNFEAFKVQANWPEGEISYSDGVQMVEAPVKQWRLSGYLVGHEPVVSLRSQQDSELLGVKLLASQELEVTVMPQMVESLGYRWPGKKEYPAFVVVQPLNDFK